MSDQNDTLKNDRPAEDRTAVEDPDVDGDLDRDDGWDADDDTPPVRSGLWRLLSGGVAGLVLTALAFVGIAHLAPVPPPPSESPTSNAGRAVAEAGVSVGEAEPDIAVAESEPTAGESVGGEPVTNFSGIEPSAADTSARDVAVDPLLDTAGSSAGGAGNPLDDKVVNKPVPTLEDEVAVSAPVSEATPDVETVYEEITAPDAERPVEEPVAPTLDASAGSEAENSGQVVEVPTLTEVVETEVDAVGELVPDVATTPEPVAEAVVDPTDPVVAEAANAAAEGDIVSSPEALEPVDTDEIDADEVIDQSALANPAEPEPEAEVGIVQSVEQDPLVTDGETQAEAETGGVAGDHTDADESAPQGVEPVPEPTIAEADPPAEPANDEQPVVDAPSDADVADNPQEPPAGDPEPAVDVAKEPSAPVAEEPALPVAEAPAQPVAEEPALPVAEAPAQPIAEEPALPVAEAPAQPIAEEPVPQDADESDTTELAIADLPIAPANPATEQVLPVVPRLASLPPGPAWEVNAVPFDQSADKPLIAVVLEVSSSGQVSPEDIFSLDLPLNIAIVPDGNAGSIAALAARSRMEVVAHMPMEPKGDADPGPEAIRTDMTPDDVIQRIRLFMSRLPQAVAASNFMGSRATEDNDLMETVIGELNTGGVAFLDTRTSRLSKALKVAQDLGGPHLRNSRFLPEDAEAQDAYLLMERAAFDARQQNGVVVVGPATRGVLLGLQRWAIERNGERARLAPLSALLKAGQGR